MALSTLPIRGLWLPAMNSLNVGVKSKKSCRMNRAVSLTPPVRALSLVSSQRRPRWVSCVTTSRAPRSLARSVGCRSRVAGNERAHVSDGGVVAEYPDDRIDERALTVRACAIGEDEGMLRREPGAAVADVTLQKALQLRIACGDAD